MIDLSPENPRTWERLASRRLLTHAVRHNGRPRKALLYVPRHIVRRGGLPLVLVFHGGASGPDAIAQITAMHRLAEKEGFIVAYPAGTRGKSGLTWVPGGRGTARMTGDPRFVRALIAELQRDYHVDPRRIFLAGFSIGGSLVYELACLFADQIAAVAVVSGTMTAAHLDPKRPVPLIHIHGTRDRRVPLEGGRGTATALNNDWLPVKASIERWRTINGCVQPANVVRRGLDGVTSHSYSGAADIEYWLLEGGGHAWPGGKRDAARGEDMPETQPTTFSATETIWRFFAAHPLDHIPPPLVPTPRAPRAPRARSLL